jgi:hypothetical protein
MTLNRWWIITNGWDADKLEAAKSGPAAGGLFLVLLRIASHSSQNICPAFRFLDSIYPSSVASSFLRTLEWSSHSPSTLTFLDVISIGRILCGVALKSGVLQAWLLA